MDIWWLRLPGLCAITNAGEHSRLRRLPAGREGKIVVLQRGPTGDPSAPEAACFPGEKAHEAVLAGWDAVLFVQQHGGTEDPTFCGSGAFVDEVVGVCTNHEAYHLMFNTAVSTIYADGPAIGTIGEKISATAAFDGWGYVHLFSNTPTGGKFADSMPTRSMRLTMKRSR